MHTFITDVCVVGGGSAGIGAALAAARSGASVVLVEKGDCLGGNAVRGGVHNWEPGVGGTAFPQEIYNRLRAIPEAAAVWTMKRHCCWPDRNTPPFPGGEQATDADRTYADTLKRHGTSGLSQDAARVREQWHGVIFEPESYSRVVESMLLATGKCRIWYNTAFESATLNGPYVQTVNVKRDGAPRKIRAMCYVDATADALVCAAAGCEIRTGQDSRSLYNELSAPEVGNSRAVNAVTLIYRITRTQTTGIEPLPAGVSSECWFGKSWPFAAIGQYPNGDYNVNMLPSMEGAEFLDYIDSGSNGYQRAHEECKRRVYGHWHFIQSNYPEFQQYRISWIAPVLGVRETRRVVGKYTLTQQDLQAGLRHQLKTHQDIIAIADHALDTHGSGNRGGCPELGEPYGIPYRCLIPQGKPNLLVAGRCASFTHIAASSCRLSRTMMDLGHAAGIAAAIAVANQCRVSEVSPAVLREKLLAAGATLN